MTGILKAFGWAALATIGAVLLMVAVFHLVMSEARAHEAASGWSYPFACCSNFDCREVADTAIAERPEGYVVKGTGEVVGHDDTRLRPSPDGRFHWCSVAGADDGRTICLFVPPRAF